jgi:excisionase family DNA binding protein
MGANPMNKEEAAAFLGCSVRQLERHVKENKIGVRYEKGRTRPTPVYDEEELRRFKEEQERPVYKPAVQRVSEQRVEGMATQGDNNDGSLSLLPQPAQMEALSKLFEMMNGQRPEPEKPRPSVPIETKMMLSVQEAGALSGLGTGAIEAAIKAGELGALRGKWRGRRVRRKELEKWVSKL